MRLWLLSALALVAGCTDTHTITGYADAASYSAEIASCIQDHDCGHLCTDVLKIPATVLDESRILQHSQYGAKFACEISGAKTSFPGGTLDDSITWDGDDDNSCDDCDDASGDDNDGDGDASSGDSASSNDSSSSDDGGCNGDDSDDDCTSGGSSAPLVALVMVGVVTLRRRR
jgi:MYXO-CTERM domain-containing protein